MDDYYELSSGLVMLQTTNAIYNTKLYDLVMPQSLFAWQRVLVANMMAHSGHEWYNIVRMYNSGTCAGALLSSSSFSVSLSLYVYMNMSFCPQFCSGEFLPWHHICIESLMCSLLTGWRCKQASCQCVHPVII